MTRRVALLVTGSRVLAGSPCEPIARAALRAALDATEGLASVIAGDASGPDAWAVEDAVGRGLIVRVYRLDGTVTDAVARRRRWWPHSEEYGSTPPARVPLLRNETMVRDLAARCAGGEWDVRCLALVAGWSQTHGTMHTVGLAHRDGIRVTTLRFEVTR